MKKYNLTPLLIFGIISIVYSFPVLQNISYWGQRDWDQFIFWNAVPRETILKYHQFPLWNPYANGGNVLLAHPHSPFLSPFYVFVLIFGPIIGLKLEIIVHLFVGLIGMFMLAKHIKLSRSAAYLASFIYMLSSMCALHLTEGHTEWLAMAFVPWVFLYYLKSFTEKGQPLGAIFFLGLILLSGSVDVFTIFVVFMSVYAVLKLFQLRQTIPLKKLSIIFLGTFLLCAIKLVPMLEFLYQYPRLTDEYSGTGLMALYKMLVGREQALLGAFHYWYLTNRMGLQYGWHEYGAYIGIIPLVLFFLGAIKRFKKNWPLILTGSISLLIALGNVYPIDLWKMLHNLPVYSSLTVPSRFILGFIFSVAILSGFGLSYLEKSISVINNRRKILWAKWIPFVIVVVVLFDLWEVNSPIFHNAFIIPPKKVTRNIFFGQRYDDVNFYSARMSRSSKYPIFLSNSGMLDVDDILGAYEVIDIKRGDVHIASNSNYKGEVYLDKSNGNILMEYFSPNKIVLDVNVKAPDILVVNQNYYGGWKVKKNDRTVRADSFKGLIATPVLPGPQRIVFYYMPLSFLIGVFVSAGFIFFVIVFRIRKSARC